MRKRWLFAVIMAEGLWTASIARAEAPPAPPYERMETVNSRGETVVYYVSHPDKPAPLALVIQDSGCIPFFELAEDGKYYGEIAVAMKRASKGRLTLIAVEKPHTISRKKYFPRNDWTSEGCPIEFIENDTLDSRLDDLYTVLQTAKNLPWVLPGPILAIGIGDGSILAPALARKDPSITDVAQFDGSGAPSPWHVIESKILENFDNIKKNDRDISDLENTFISINKNSNSTSMWLYGYPYKYWSSYIKHIPLDDMLNNNSRIYINYTYSYGQVHLSSTEMLVSGLISHGRDVTICRNMPLDKDYETNYKQIVDQYNKIIDWFLAYQNHN